MGQATFMVQPGKGARGLHGQAALGPETRVGLCGRESASRGPTGTQGTRDSASAGGSRWEELSCGPWPCPCVRAPGRVCPGETRTGAEVT